MEEQFIPLISEEERAERRARRAERRRQKIRARRIQQLRLVLPCVLCLAVLVGAVSAGAKFQQTADAGQPSLQKAVRDPSLRQEAPPLSAAYETSPDTAVLEGELNSGYAVLVDAQSGTILASKHHDTVINPASMTKILTALVAAEHAENLDDTVTITLEITDYCYVNDCSVVGLMVGEAVPVRELFYGTILSSGADAALALATYVAGSHEAFVAMMNEKLEELGLSDTAHFTNCVGLYDKNHACTVLDMAVILRAAMENDLCRKVLSAHTYETAPTEQHPEGQVLSNWFLRKIEDHDTDSAVRAVGAKTGYVAQSGSCAASWGEDAAGNVYLCVTADAGSSWQAIYDHVALYKTHCS